MLTLRSQVGFLFLLSAICQIDSLEDVVFDKYPQKKKGTAYFSLHPLYCVHFAFFLVLVPLANEVLIQHSKLAGLNYDLFACAVAEVRVDNS
jgi:hypothetical protein